MVAIDDTCAHFITINKWSYIGLIAFYRDMITWLRHVVSGTSHLACRYTHVPVWETEYGVSLYVCFYCFTGRVLDVDTFSVVCCVCVACALFVNGKSVEMVIASGAILTILS
jgi:hypothetical protein